MAVNSMSLPEIRGNPIQAKPVRSTRAGSEGRAPVVAGGPGQSPCQKDQEERGQGGGDGQELDRVAADLLESGGRLYAGDIRRQRQAVDAGDEA